MSVRELVYFVPVLLLDAKARRAVLRPKARNRTVNSVRSGIVRMLRRKSKPIRRASR
jgi:hypothetical protein